MNITVNGVQPAQNVNIAVHNMKNKAGAAEINRSIWTTLQVQELTLDAEGKGQYVFNASYVKAPNSPAVTAGHVTT